MKVKVAIAALACLAAAGAARAEERLGVAVYPGSKYDADTSKAVAEMVQGEAASFSSADPVGKVAAFYQKQGLKLVGSIGKEHALFKKGAVDVTIQNPWLDMKTGAMMKTTLVTVARPKQ